MRISKVGGVIAAASKKAAFPLQQVGTIPVIKRIVLMFQQAGVFPIVVVTGAQEDEVRYQLSASGVVFLPAQETADPELLHSVKTGLAFLADKCAKAVFVPVNVPMFSPKTLNKLIATEGDIVTPSYKKQGGHPVVMASHIIPQILAYTGDNGLRGAISQIACNRKWLEVEDEGILYTVHDEKLLEGYLEQHNKKIMRPALTLSLRSENVFFSARTKLLLLLISHTSSVRRACELMALSYSKAWSMLNELEEQLGYPVLQRQHGGSRGGRTRLTKQGIAFLKAYQQMEEDALLYISQRFDATIVETGVIEPKSKFL